MKTNHYKITTFISVFIIIIGIGISQAQVAERALEEFSSLKLTKSFEVIITQGNSCSIRMEGDEKAAEKIKTEVKDNTLKITCEEPTFNLDNLKIYITVKDLKRIELSGASDVKSTSMITVDKLTIEASGAGNVTLQVIANEVTAEISGAGDVNLSGTTNLLNAKVSGAGDLKAFKLETKKAIVKTSGAGDAKVNVKESLTAEISGNGNIIYKGEPVDRQVEINGFGSVRQSNNESDINIETPYNSEKGDTTRFRIGGNRVIIIDDNDTAKSVKNKRKKENEVKDIWGGLELGVNGFMNSNNQANLPANYDYLALNYGKSFNINLNMFEKHLKLYQNYIALTTGLGFEFNRYMFKENITLIPNTKNLEVVYNNYGFQKNCLKDSYINVPLLLEFNTNKKAKKSFHFAAGVIGGYRLSSKTKQVFELAGRTIKNKVSDDYNLNPFKYGATVRMGYGKFNVFATYSLSTLFEQNTIAPQLYPFTVGVTLLHF